MRRAVDFYAGLIFAHHARGTAEAQDKAMSLGALAHANAGGSEGEIHGIAVDGKGNRSRKQL